LIVKGAGKPGRTRVASVALHFADSYTAYGPIVPEKEGVLCIDTGKPLEKKVLMKTATRC